MSRHVFAAVLALVLIASIMAPTLSAQESSDDFENEPRDLEAPTIDDGRFEIRSFGPAGDRIRTEFRARDGELRLDFTPPDNTTVEVQLTLTMEALVEFFDEDGDGFDDREEVQTIEVDEMVFEGPSFEPVDGGYRIEVQYGLPESDFSLMFVFWVFESPTEVGGAAVRPTEVKFDVALSFFPFEQDESDVALRVELKTEVEPKLNFTGTQVELEAVGQRYEGFFGWSRMVLVDGVESQVLGTVLKDELEQEGGGEVEFERTVLLAYPRGEEIVHDPIVGVAVAVPPSILPPPNGVLNEIGKVVAGLDFVIYFLVLGASGLFVFLTLLARRRRG